MLTLGQKRDYVARFFGATGATYDEVVRRGTFGIDRIWKRRLLAKLERPRRVLDLACGTGILTLEIARRYPQADVVGVDITEGYLAVARRKAAAERVGNVQFVRSWAEEFEAAAPFDAITSSYLAKYADIARLAPRLAAMLAPGGSVLFHDFSYPANPVLARLWEQHMKLLKRLGGRRYPEWRAVFDELPDLVRRTRWVEELPAALRAAGLIAVTVEPLTLQGATLVSARNST
jgi:demethylmenaquinone methyltransferase/2-methoxy-6-polyprenyl-1,4-benzoquinol methylase